MAVSFYDTNLNEEDVERMNSESAPEELKNDVFKPFRDQVDLTDSDQAERFGRVRNKVVENLKTTTRNILYKKPSYKKVSLKKSEN